MLILYMLIIYTLFCGVRALPPVLNILLRRKTSLQVTFHINNKEANPFRKVPAVPLPAVWGLWVVCSAWWGLLSRLWAVCR